MASFESFVLKLKPTLDRFLRAPNKGNLKHLQQELTTFNWMQMKIFHAQILAPLVLKLEELSGIDQDLQAGTMDCIRIVMSKLYIDDLRELRTLLVIILNQVRECDSVSIRRNLSEELKLVAVQCISEALRRANSDVLELFYTQESAMLLGQILLTLVEFIEKEKFKKLIITSLETLMVVFYVHDNAEFSDVVLRNLVADTVFIFLPKVVTVLFKTCLSDEKFGETLKSTAIKALGRILCIIYDESSKSIIKRTYNKIEFQNLIDNALKQDSSSIPLNEDILSSRKKSAGPVSDRLKTVQENGRSQSWFDATSSKLRTIYMETITLRSHDSVQIRAEYAKMCCSLIQYCGGHLQINFIYVLESVVALSEDEDATIRLLCRRTLQNLQRDHVNERIFDDNSDILFDEHVAKFPGIINRRDEAEQYAELIFLKGFLHNLSATKLQLLLSVRKNLDMFCLCLLMAVDLKVTQDLLLEEYALRELSEADFAECAKLHWRQYKNLTSLRCVKTVKDICEILGSTRLVKRLVYDFLFELLGQTSENMNEILLILLWMATAPESRKHTDRLELVNILLQELLNDRHWYLALQPDPMHRLKADKSTNWFIDRTPGLYESAIEIRVQDMDSDDEKDIYEMKNRNCVTVMDAEFNVLHTCLILDALGHCAEFYGETFDRYLFRCLHKVLLKLANSNTMTYQAANFCLISIQKALKFAKVTDLIETHTDYISFHLNTILKRSPESSAAVDILTVVLQLSTRNTMPHLESIFRTIREECCKSHQTENIYAFLKVFNAFLTYMTKWQLKNDIGVADAVMQMDVEQDEDILTNCLEILDNPRIVETFKSDIATEPSEEVNLDKANAINDIDPSAENSEIKPALPKHIEIVKEIVNEAIKFVSSVDKTQQILSLECLISGVPLLKDYEDELLPLVHLIWPSLIEKFRQKDTVVLNRCFTMLNVLAANAKEFILKRSLDDVIPFLKEFLDKTSYHSKAGKSTSQTQEYKLQKILLHNFAALIQNIQIDGKQLNEIAEVVSQYLSEEQPKELQDHAVQFYRDLKPYDSPLTYMIVLKKSHMKVYKRNVARVLTDFGLK